MSFSNYILHLFHLDTTRHLASHEHVSAAVLINCWHSTTRTHPSGVGKWVPASAGKAKTGMVHSVSGWTRGVQVKLWDPLRTRAISEQLRGVFTTRCYTNPRLLYLTLHIYVRTRWLLTINRWPVCYVSAVTSTSECITFNILKVLIWPYFVLPRPWLWPHDLKISSTHLCPERHISCEFDETCTSGL